MVALGVPKSDSNAVAEKNPSSAPAPLNVRSVSEPASQAQTTFEALDLPQTSETFQNLKPAGSAFSDLIGVPKYLVSRAIEKIGDMYTDYRLTQAATQMATFTIEAVDRGSSADTILKQWGAMADKNAAYTGPMNELGGGIAEILRGQIEKITPFRQQVDNALSEIKKASSIDDFTGLGVAAQLRALPPQGKKEVLDAYASLRTSLASLQSIAHDTREQATAFYHTASECFKRHDAFSMDTAPTLHWEARRAYRQEIAAIHESYVTALHTLASSPSRSAEEVADAGKRTLTAIETLQERIVAFSSAREAADEVTNRLDQTLSYLSKGVESAKSLETESNQKFVTVSDKTADALVEYVNACTTAERKTLKEVLKSQDLARITDATEALQKKSDEVHARLSEAARVLSKVNAGYDRTTDTATPDQAEQILTLLRANKMSEDDIAAVKGRVHGFVEDLRGKLEERITKIFSVDAEGKRIVTPTEQKEIQILAAYADDFLEQVQGMKKPTKEQITSEIKLSERGLNDALSTRDRDEERKLANKKARIAEMLPKPWWKFW